jgi:hypothetical protein
MLVSCFLFFDPEGGGNVSVKCPLPFNGLCGIISLKIELFITAFVGTQILQNECYLSSIVLQVFLADLED